jgi:ABC-2 type transport system ATP-binding protein
MSILEKSLGCLAQVESDGVVLSIMANTPTAANEALSAVVAADIDVASFSMGSPSLDEVFFALTGAGLDETIGEKVT